MYDAFLSYDWCLDELGRENHDRVTAINRQLRSLGVKTWFNAKKAKDLDYATHVKSGIDRSKTVLLFITENYIKKVSDAVQINSIEFYHSISTKPTTMILGIIMERRTRRKNLWPKEFIEVFGDSLIYDMAEDADVASVGLQIKSKIDDVVLFNESATVATTDNVFSKEKDIKPQSKEGSVSVHI